MHNRKGFTLVELSIVLVILGLLVGGVLAGQSLIRASELRRVSVEYTNYTTAAYAFREKYIAIPGDMNNATRFWGRQVAAADCTTNSSASVSSTGVCDGDGTGALDNGAAAGALKSGEAFQFWRHLAAAGLVEGVYTGLSGSGGGGHAVVGQNIPSSKLSGAGWTALQFDNSGSPGDLYIFALNYGNAYIFGGNNTSGPTYSSGSKLSAPELWGIDTKLDDGKPGTGKVIAYYWDSCTDAASATAYNSANYDLSASQTNACVAWFRNAF